MEDIINEIGMYLTYDEVINLCNANPQYNKILCNNDNFWKRKIDIDFTDKISFFMKHDKMNWKNNYKTMHHINNKINEIIIYLDSSVGDENEGKLMIVYIENNSYPTNNDKNDKLIKNFQMKYVNSDLVIAINKNVFSGGYINKNKINSDQYQIQYIAYRNTYNEVYDYISFYVTMEELYNFLFYCIYHKKDIEHGFFEYDNNT